MAELVGLLPAAGTGVRAYPQTATVPKSMLEVDGVPILQRNVELMRDQLGIRDIRIVVGYHGDVIRRHFGDGSAFGVAISYAVNMRLDLDLPYSILLGGQGITSPCCMILADECYVGSNHRELLAAPHADALVVCGVMRAEYAKQIRKNYTVTLADGRIVDLHEKPTTVADPLMGTGTYLMCADVFRRLAEAFGDDPARGPRDWTTWLASLAHQGALMRPFYLTGKYVNINSRDDLNYANCLVREADFERRTASLVYVLERDEEAALRPLAEYGRLPELDEVIAVARRPSAALEQATANAKIRLVTPPTPELRTGALVRLGLDAATGDMLLLCGGDDTFSPRDVAKFLVYLRDADMVIGTRTTRQLIEQGTNMRGIVRASHIVLAKLLELVWWRFEYRFTDICCMYSGLWRSTYETIGHNLSAADVGIFPEMVIEVLRARRRIVEIPINYYNRDLQSDRVRSEYQTLGTFLRGVRLIVRKRWDDLGGWRSTGRA
jgi:dTDP-glucose pyrophosphorylase